MCMSRFNSTILRNKINMFALLKVPAMKPIKNKFSKRNEFVIMLFGFSKATFILDASID